MATKPITAPLEGDLPENWRTGQNVTTNGTSTGLTAKYGYNYLMRKVNEGINALNALNNAFTGLAELDGGQVPDDQLPQMLKMGVARVIIPASGWTQTSGGDGWEQTVIVPALLSVENAVIIADLDSNRTITNGIITDWSNVSTITGGEGGAVHFKCLEAAPANDIPLALAWFSPQMSSGGATQPYVEYETDEYGYITSTTFYGAAVPPYAFSGSNGYGRMTTARISEGCEALRDYAFSASGLSSVFLPTTLKYIDSNAFYNCASLQEITIPAAVEYIGRYAFRNNTRLQTATFQGTPEEIHATAFSGCTALLTINVPWAEGAVAGAPWGATNATINYNSQ